MKEIKLCECGCGNPAPIAKKADKRWGHKKGLPVRFFQGHRLSGPLSPSWRGGVSKGDEGRNRVLLPEHHRANGSGRVFAYILVAEKALEKPLPLGAVVHHVDGDAGNDKNDNLVICENNVYHLFLHQRKRAYDACGHSWWRKCYICKQHDDPKNLSMPLTRGSIFHNKCKRRYLHARKTNCKI